MAFHYDNRLRISFANVDGRDATDIIELIEAPATVHNFYVKK
jgi:hypothetical protein